MKRRNFLVASGGLVAGTGLLADSWGNELHPDTTAKSAEDQLQNWGFVGPELDPEFGARITGQPGGAATAGTGPSRNREVAKAARLLFDSSLEVLKRATGKEEIVLMKGKGGGGGEGETIKTGVFYEPWNPISYAAYFSQLTDRNEDGELYKAEWNGDRANPLIVSFFGMTNTLPSEGDQTAWCAAFVNMCLRAAGRRGTLSALSGSFRKFELDAAKHGGPKLGDVVVFKRADEKGALGFGHVGFFVAEDDDKIWVLGGNQRSDKPTKGEVTTVPFSKVSQDLIWLSNRRIREEPL